MSLAYPIDGAPFTLAEWLELETDPYQHAPYDRPCPACGDSMVDPTSCRCDYELRVAALAGMLETISGVGPFPMIGEWTRPNLIAVNAAMRALDDSSSWPIRSRFNGTDRAIRRARDSASSLDSYVRSVDEEIGRIVNDPNTL